MAMLAAPNMTDNYTEQGRPGFLSGMNRLAVRIPGDIRPAPPAADPTCPCCPCPNGPYEKGRDRCPLCLLGQHVDADPINLYGPVNEQAGGLRLREGAPRGGSTPPSPAVVNLYGPVNEKAAQPEGQAALNAEDQSSRLTFSTRSTTRASRSRSNDSIQLRATDSASANDSIGPEYPPRFSSASKLRQTTPNVPYPVGPIRAFAGCPIVGHFTADLLTKIPAPADQRKNRVIESLADPSLQSLSHLSSPSPARSPFQRHYRFRCARANPISGALYEEVVGRAA